MSPTIAALIFTLAMPLAEAPLRGLHTPAPVGAPLEFVMVGNVEFIYDKYTLEREARLALDAVALMVRDNTAVQRILIYGHTDSRGTQRYNDRLSDRRTAAVRGYLIDKGLNPDMLKLIGYSKDRPIDENWTREGRARNRHVDIYAVMRPQSAPTPSPEIPPESNAAP